MSLHPELAALLAHLTATGSQRASTGTPEQARARFSALLAQLPASTQAIAGEREHDIDGPGGPLRLRLYTPTGRGPFPMIVYCHGGGFVIGSLDDYAGICRELCGLTGAIVVAIDYRRAPEFRFPAAPDDCLAATRWVGAQAAALGGDATRIAIAGDSAGGTLATVTALRIRDEGGPALCAQLLVYPATDHASRDTDSLREFAQGPLLSRADIDWFAAHYLRSAADIDDPRACPLRAASLAALPPTFVMTAECDPVRDEGEAYARRLQAEGVDCRLQRYAGAAHGALFLFPSFAIGRQLIDDGSAWLRARFA